MIRGERNRHRKRPRSIAVDLFCGAGGMSLGFQQAGFSIAAAVDISPINIAIHKKNFPETVTICGDLREITGTRLRSQAGLDGSEIDVVFGGPPCQGFSIGGKQQVTDPRNELLLEFGRLVIELQPKYFVLENVGGLLSPRYSPLLREFGRLLRRGGYSLLEPVTSLDAANFGVPQRRKRVFVLGWRHGQGAPSYPKGERERVSVGAAIDDLKVGNRAKLLDGDSYAGPLGFPSSYAMSLRKARNGKALSVITGFARTKHSSAIVERFRRIEQGGHDPVSRFIRLDRNGLAPTLRAGTGPDNGRFMAPRPIHPDYPRCITLREAARLHSFPDWFVFHNTKWNGFMQVGNSVPPALALAVAGQIIAALNTKQNGSYAKQGNDLTTHGDRQVPEHRSRDRSARNRTRTGHSVSAP